MSYIVLRGHWYIIVPNTRAPTEEKWWFKGQFLRGITAGVRPLSKHHVKILLGDFNAKLGREDNFKLTIRMRVYMKIVIMMGLE
jgi:hypothetical protein